jgi:triosephosphate isomerase (TIM)
MRKIIGGNWKMNGSPTSMEAFMAAMGASGSPGLKADVVVFPPFTMIPLAASRAPAGVEIGGQDLFWEPKGAYTGEISPSILLDAGATWFLAGHSERRHVIGETDAMVRRKLDAGLAAGMRGILCVGETLGEREAGRTEEVVRGQVGSGLSGLEATPRNLVLAYEPVWAIGTGLNATPGEVERMHSLIRGWVSGIAGEVFSSSLRIQYGGSVNPSNAGALLSMPSVDGALVGGASLEAGSFLAIIAAAG